MTAPPQFKTIPQHDELQQLERDLRFHPSPVTDPEILTPALVEQFNQQGYLRPFRIFTSDEMVQHRAYFDSLLARVLAAGGSSYSISTAHLQYGKVYDLLTHPRIVTHVRD